MNIKIIILTVLAIIVTMAGTASAGITVVTDGNTHHVTVSASGGVKSLTINGIQYNGDGTPFNAAEKFTVRIDGAETTSVSGNFPNPKTFVVTYTNDKGAPNGNYMLEYSASYIGGIYRITKYYKAQVNLYSIPEFPTLALPIASVLAIMFIAQKRKKEE